MYPDQRKKIKGRLARNNYCNFISDFLRTYKLPTQTYSTHTAFHCITNILGAGAPTSTPNCISVLWSRQQLIHDLLKRVCLSFPNLSEDFFFLSLEGMFDYKTSVKNWNSTNSIQPLPQTRMLCRNWMYLPGSHTRQRCFHVSIPRKSKTKTIS